MTNDKCAMSDEPYVADGVRKYDLAERTAKLGEAILAFAGQVPQTLINRPLILQLVRSATSIGANYMEADGAESKKDFQHKIGITKKETKETEHWLRMIGVANLDLTIACRSLWKETHELTLIFSAILKSSREGETKETESRARSNDKCQIPNVK